MRAFATVFLIFCCQTGAARVRAVASWVPRPQRILVITAHPDDEILLAPFLASHCIDRGASCAILVLTRGEAGGDPHVRTAEMARAAAMLNLRLTQQSLPDVLAPWPDREAIVEMIRSVVASENPDMILTFDPEHGTTGHPAHRETGALVRDSGAQNVWLLETLARIEPDGIEIGVKEPFTWAFAGDWQYVIRDAANHSSQFTEAQVESLRTVPPERRRVWLRRQ
ncbi:MAG TPA: PIG-L family deacetylase [Thermoanaerobaculia bacterium]|nr:PIG-L family deacetylase [Thermoanaerobaculia bacterium]